MYLFKKFKNSIIKSKNILSSGSVLGLVVFENQQQLPYSNFKKIEILEKNINILQTYDYSWVSNEFGANNSGSLWFTFSIFWFSLLFFITFLNIGLTSLLFLLEVALLTPIASMQLLNILPFSAILYFLNAITMEAVIGVVIALCYSRDWGHRDFTKYEVLEGNYFFINFGNIFKNGKKKISISYSWSIFFEYSLFILHKNKIIGFFILYSIVFYLVCINYNYFFNYFNLYKIFENTLLIFILYEKNAVPSLSSILSIFLKTPFNFEKNLNNQQSFRLNEFFNYNNTTYFEFLEKYSENINYFLDIFKYQNYEIFKKKKSDLFFFENYRLSSYYRSKLFIKHNPNDYLYNLLIIAGLMYNPLEIKKNNINFTHFSDNYNGFISTKSVNNNLNQNLSELSQNNATGFASEILNYDKILNSTLYNFNINRNVKSLTLNNESEFLLKNFGYAFGIKYHNNINCKYKNTILNKNFNITDKFNIFFYEPYNYFLEKNIQKVKTPIDFISGFIENDNWIYTTSITSNLRNYYLKKIIKLKKNSSITKNFDSFFNKKVLIPYFLNNFRRPEFINIKYLMTVPKQKLNLNQYSKFKIYRQSDLLNNNITNLGIIYSDFKIFDKFINVSYKNINRFTNKINLFKKNFFRYDRFFKVYSKTLTIKNIKSIKLFTDGFENIKTNLNSVFLISKNKLEWGSKNVGVIYDFKSKTLPWFDYSNSDEYLIDKSASRMFDNNVFRSDANIFENNDRNVNFISKFKINDLVDREKNISRFFKKKKNTYYIRSYKSLKKKKPRKLKKLLNSKRKWKFARNKSKIWKLQINWSFENNLESLYGFLYKNTNILNLENKLYLKRTGMSGHNGPLMDFRQISKFGNYGFDNSVISVRSPQSRDFGLLFINNNDNFEKLNIFNNFKYYSNKIVNRKLFSYKTINSYKSLSKFKSLVPINNITSTNNLNSSKISVSSRFLKLKNNEILKNFTNRNQFNNTNDIENFIFETGNSFYKKSKVFWTIGSYKLKNSYNYYEFNKKSTVNDRFLLTFHNILKNREKWSNNLSNRLNKYSIKNKLILNFLQNSFRMNILPKNFIKDNLTYNSDFNNKIIKNKKEKILINDDFEINSVNTRSSLLKPHTVYGLLWDEYLKQTYGFSLNFLNFDNKLKNVDNNFKFSKKIEILNNDFQENLERSLNVNDPFIGLTKDSFFGNEITAKLLTRSGFFKELNILGNLESDSFYKKFKKNLKFIKNLKNKNKNSTFLKKKNIKKYFKKKLLKTTIEKNSLVKKTIGYIKKFSEIPTGFKYDNLEIGYNLPYLKKKFWIKNENFYIKNNLPKKKSWLSIKNNTNNILNRAAITKLSTNKTYLDDNFYFKRKKKYKKVLKLNGISFNNFTDYKKLSSNVNEKTRRSPFYIDKNNDFFIKNSLKNKTKRNLERIKSKKNKNFSKRFEILKKTTLGLFKKNRNKKFSNFKLFFKTNINQLDIIGGGIPSTYSNTSKIDNFIFYQNLYKIRNNKYFDNFNIFEHRAVKHIRNSDDITKFLTNKNILGFYKNYKKISNSKIDINDFWGLSSILKNIRLDGNYLENSINKKNLNKKNLASAYKLSKVGKIDFKGFEYSFFLSLYDMPNFLIFKDSDIIQNNGIFSDFYKEQSYLESILTIKNKKFSGLNDYTLNFNQFYSIIIKRLRVFNNIKYNKIICKSNPIEVFVKFNLKKLNILKKYLTLYKNIKTFYNIKNYTNFYKIPITIVKKINWFWLKLLKFIGVLLIIILLKLAINKNKLKICVNCL